MPKFTVLIIEDEKNIQTFVGKILKKQDYRVLYADCGKEGLNLIHSQCPDVIILDLGLPDMNGNDIIQEVRTWTSTPIIVISARSAEKEKVLALDQGADDYITKPFSMPILIRKIAAVLRRSSQGTVESYQSITYGNLLLNCDGYTATMNGNTFELTQKEFEILRELLTHQGRILTRQNLLDKLWRYDFYGDERVVDTHIKNLRKKLGIGFIQTIRGLGYKIDKEN